MAARIRSSSARRRRVTWRTSARPRPVTPISSARRSPLGPVPLDQRLPDEAVAHPGDGRGGHVERGRQLARPLRSPGGQHHQRPVLGQRDVAVQPGQRSGGHRHQGPAGREDCVDQLLVAVSIDQLLVAVSIDQLLVAVSIDQLLVAVSIDQLLVAVSIDQLLVAVSIDQLLVAACPSTSSWSPCPSTSSWSPGSGSGSGSGSTCTIVPLYYASKPSTNDRGGSPNEIGLGSGAARPHWGTHDRAPHLRRFPRPVEPRRHQGQAGPRYCTRPTTTPWGASRPDVLETGAAKASLNATYTHPAAGRMGHSDPTARLADMDTDGVEAEVVYCEVSSYRYLYLRARDGGRPPGPSTTRCSTTPRPIPAG